MALRYVHVPASNGVGVKDVALDFNWFPGFSLSQKRRSIQSLHEAAREAGYGPILEISSKSEEACGVMASAFNLEADIAVGCTLSVEAAFQGSKVFERAGPFPEIYAITARDAKRAIPEKQDGALVRFDFFGEDVPLVPRTLFYDWLYIKALTKSADVSEALCRFNGFSDIEFNPKKSINCQAFSAALFVSLKRSGLLEAAIKSVAAFQAVLSDLYAQRPERL